MTLRMNFYSGARIDRASHIRADVAWIRDRLLHPETRLVPVWQSQNLIRHGERPSAGMPRVADLPDIADRLGDGSQLALLGLVEGVPYFAFSVRDDDEELSSRFAPHGEFMGLRTVGSVLDDHEAALLAYARGLMHWHSRSGFCSVCGHPTRSVAAGHLRVCTNERCGAEHHPRTDPAVIMLVSNGDQCLLGRQASWPRGMHSTLAGFVEPGESLEEAVVREVFEESGIRVRNIRYHSSQPWPFPASIMIGFYAEADSTEIAPVADELEAVGWYSRQSLKQAHDELEFRLPPALSIARRLADDWIGENI